MGQNILDVRLTKGGPKHVVVCVLAESMHVKTLSEHSTRHAINDLNSILLDVAPESRICLETLAERVASEKDTTRINNFKAEGSKPRDSLNDAVPALWKRAELIWI